MKDNDRVMQLAISAIISFCSTEINQKKLRVIYTHCNGTTCNIYTIVCEKLFAEYLSTLNNPRVILCTPLYRYITLYIYIRVYIFHKYIYIYIDHMEILYIFNCPD